MCYDVNVLAEVEHEAYMKFLFKSWKRKKIVKVNKI